jgi:hypothetical protein
MRKKAVAFVVMGAVVSHVGAQTVLFRTSTNYVTTGEAIEGIENTALATNVQEIAGLQITARSGDPEHRLNANSQSFGINNLATNADEAARFEAGEKMILSFDKSVVITNLDFRAFDAGEAFTVAVAGQAPVVVDYDGLDNKTSDHIATNISVSAGTEIEWFTTGTGEIGLESIGLEVSGNGGGVTLSLQPSNSTVYVIADFDGAATTNYVLQSSTNLVSNAWDTVSGTISSDTNISVDASPPASFFRIIVE